MSDTPDNNGASEEVNPQPKRPTRATRPKPKKPLQDALPKIVQPAPKPLLPDGFVFAEDLDAKVQQWLWHQIIPAGALTVVAGAPGVSKSSLLIDVAAKVTKGSLDGDFKGKPQNVLYLSREDSPLTSLVPKLMGAGAWATEDRREGDGRVIFLDPKRAGNMRFPADVTKLAQLIQQHSIGVVILDSLMSFMETSRSLHGNYQAAVGAMTPLAEMCAKAEVTLIGVMHLRKDADTAGLGAIIGSIGISATARHVVMVGNAPMSDSRIIGVVKSNLGPELVGQVYDVYWRTVAEDSSGLPVKASVIEVIRPASMDEVANMLEKRKPEHGDAQNIQVLAAIKDGESRRSVDVHALVNEAMAVGERQVRRVLGRLSSLGLVEEARKEGSNAFWYTINGRGLAMVQAFMPNSLDTPPEADAEEAPPSRRRPKFRMIKGEAEGEGETTDND